MLKGIYLILFSFLIVACDAGLDSNFESTDQELIIDKANKASLEEVESLRLIGDYRLDLISKKIDPARKQKFEFTHHISIIKFPSKTIVNGKQVPLYRVKAIISYVPKDEKLSSLDYPILLANVYFSSINNEITIILGSEDGGGISVGSNGNGAIFLATGSIEADGFKMDRIYTHLGEFEPAFMYRISN
ncbi:MAG: hypothetical protein H6625_08225 [Bdellovibrionaceae bacterium]|nr:hypothetical protein [Pseudobdellovibrionaceae bacterium]